ncbi:MAG: 3-keto-5-aminohexanoate cleavage protein, partial [Candidatus Saccharibacteria bacterium]|nr:3-keto-5-aminohexanoate cleavage protein [Pseudorhodobacter sp.]
ELFYDPARNPTNLELLQETQAIAKEVGRPLATQQGAREIYGIAAQSAKGYKPA